MLKDAGTSTLHQRQICVQVSFGKVRTSNSLLSSYSKTCVWTIVKPLAFSGGCYSKQLGAIRCCACDGDLGRAPGAPHHLIFERPGDGILFSKKKSLLGIVYLIVFCSLHWWPGRLEPNCRPSLISYGGINSVHECADLTSGMIFLPVRAPRGSHVARLFVCVECVCTDCRRSFGWWWVQVHRCVYDQLKASGLAGSITFLPGMSCAHAHISHLFSSFLLSPTNVLLCLLWLPPLMNRLVEF